MTSTKRNLTETIAETETFQAVEETGEMKVMMTKARQY
jgi:hypothetical protein